MKWISQCVCVYDNIGFTLSGRCSIKVHMTSSIAVRRLGARPQRQADCRSSRAFATGSPGHTLPCKMINGNDMWQLSTRKIISQISQMNEKHGLCEPTSGWALTSLIQLMIPFLACINSCSLIRSGSFPSSISGHPSVCRGLFCRYKHSHIEVIKPYTYWCYLLIICFSNVHLALQDRCPL